MCLSSPLMFVSSVGSPLQNPCVLKKKKQEKEKGRLSRTLHVPTSDPPRPVLLLLGCFPYPNGTMAAYKGWPGLTRKHRSARRNVRSNEILVFAPGIVRECADFLLRPGVKDVFEVFFRKRVYWRRLMVNARNYRVGSCCVLRSGGSVPVCLCVFVHCRAWSGLAR